MRVTGGTARGQLLKVPRNFEIRPTTDRVREAVFSMLGSLLLKWQRCLDLFAGTGALGIEALSRGMEWADFVDKDRRCCDIIGQNLEKIGFRSHSRIYCEDASEILWSLQEKYDCIFMDPPYADTSTESVLEEVGDTGILNQGAILVVSHSSRVQFNEAYAKLALIKAKHYGDSSISIYRAEVTS